MKKKASMRKYILVTVLVVIGILLSVCRVDIVNTLQQYQGFINAINYGGDFSQSTLVSFEVSARDGANITDQDVLTTMDKLYTLADGTDNAYEDIRVYRQDTADDKVRICVLVPNTTINTTMFELLEDTQELVVRKTSDTSGAAIITNEHIYTASYTTVSDNIGVLVKLNAEGISKITTMIAQLGSSQPYCFIDGTSMSGQVYGNDNEYLFIYSSGMTASEASTTAMALVAGSYPVDLTYISSSTSITLSPSLGSTALLAVGLITLVILAMIIVFMVLRYKILGLISTLSLAINSVLMAMFIQGVPLISFTMTSFFACIYGLIIFVVSNVVLFNAMSNEYKVGKKIPACISMGYKKVVVRIADIHIVQILVALFLLMLGSTTLKSFAIIMIIALVLSLLCTLIFTKVFVKWYLPINSSDATKYNFTREANIDEIN